MSKAQAPRQKHIPQRTCIVCKQKTDKRQLTRIVRTTDAGVVADPSGKRNGRGAYVCDQPACWEKAINGRLLVQALLIPELTAPEKEALLAYKAHLQASRAHTKPAPVA